MSKSVVEFRNAAEAKYLESAATLVECGERSEVRPADEHYVEVGHWKRNVI